MRNRLNGLLDSRKFWLAVFGVVTALVFHFFTDIPMDIWRAIEILVAVLIMSIAIEDSGAKSAKGQGGQSKK